MGDFWIKEAVGKKGGYRASVSRRYGKSGFTGRGTIKQEIIARDSQKSGKIGKQARLAKTLRRMRQ
jgi:hypothetical protein